MCGGLVAEEARRGVWWQAECEDAWLQPATRAVSIGRQLGGSSAAARRRHLLGISTPWRAGLALTLTLTTTSTVSTPWRAGLALTLTLTTTSTISTPWRAGSLSAGGRRLPARRGVGPRAARRSLSSEGGAEG